MYQDTITFQLATHYLPKIALRLECLYQTINQACEETHPVIHHYALKNIIEIIHIIEKPELKSRFLKELMRIEHALIKSNITLTAELFDGLHFQIQQISHIVGRFGDGIHQDPFLQIFRSTQPSANQDGETYSPQLLYWLESRPAIRQRDLALWLTNLHSLYLTVGLYLKLLRSTAEFNTVAMLNGFYQRSLPPKTSCHLILLRIDKSFGIVPRMQLGHHGFNLRLCEATTMREIKDSNALFDLAICQL
ncbi:MAG: cell division protein ZapD [Legionella sp.]|nr:cell division protein ZapD [Legionella sp.]